MNERILVTGGSGMLGAYILRKLLASGYTHITSTYYQHKDHIPVDLRDRIDWQPLAMPDIAATHDLVHGHDWVIHNAGLISYRKGDKEKLLDINQTGTQQIVNACLASSVSHLVYIGSIASLGKEKNGVTLDEKSPWLDNAFSTNYGLSKYLGELEVWRGNGEGLPVSVVLPSLIMGAGHEDSTGIHLVDQMITKPGYYPGGQTGFIAAADIAAFVVLLLQQHRTGERWLLSHVNLTFAELYKRISEKLKLKKKFRPAPKLLSGIYLHAASLLGKGHLGPELLNQSYSTFSYNGSKSLSVEGFAYTDIDEAIEEMVDAYQHYSTETLV